MTDPSIHDPSLQALEARLANMVLRVSPGNAQKLFYQCAFEAGQTKARKVIRRWQVSTAALVVVALFLSLFAMNQNRGANDLVQKAPPDTNQIGSPVVSATETQSGGSTSQDIAIQARREFSVDLDAWQLHKTNGGTLDNELAVLRHSDSSSRSYTVSALTRAVLVP